MRFEAEGCAIVNASADLMAETVAGKTLAQVEQIAGISRRSLPPGARIRPLGELNALAGIAEYPSRMSCATLPWHALIEALHHV